MTEHEHLLAWAYYLGASVLFYVVFWYVSRNWWRELKQLLRALLAAILFTPWYTLGDQGYMSPAWLSSVADLLLAREGGFMRAGFPLLIAICAALALSSALAFWQWFSRKSA
ncbi:hypothetical protein [Agaribacterium sp. ZY112]|uniref:hypothetical protein n=1 Tax=Agaribacterium sp. ZY112 TaxID=3233574 RepID=UPI0035247BEF